MIQGEMPFIFVLYVLNILDCILIRIFFFFRKLSSDDMREQIRNSKTSKTAVVQPESKYDPTTVPKDEARAFDVHY